MEAGLAEDKRFIRALCDWAKLRPSAVAKRAGVAATTITRPYKGTADTRISQPTKDKLRAAFPDFPGWGAASVPMRSEVVASDIDDPRLAKYGAEPLPPIPVVGSAMGVSSFDPERHVELTELDMAEVLDHVDRPVSLARDSRAYAVTIVGDSMWPRFRPGRRVIVSPRAPVAIGDDVIVQLRGGNSGEGEYADRVTTVLIKELVRRTASHIELRQFNPDTVFTVPVEQVAEIHKVVGEMF